MKNYFYVSHILSRLDISREDFDSYASKLEIHIENEKITPGDFNRISHYHFNKAFIIANESQPKKGGLLEKLKTRKVALRLESIPAELKEECVFAESFRKLTLTDSPFSGRSHASYELPDGQKFKTILSAEESAIICGGLEQGRAREYGRRYFAGELTENEILEMIYLANKTLEKYGPELVNFCLSLPRLPFKALNADKLFHQFDHSRTRSKLSSFRTVYKDHQNKDQRIEIKFYKEFGSNKEVLVVSRLKSNQRIMQVARNGNIIVEPDITDIKPILMLFQRFDSDSKKLMIHYGLETGECSRCGRLLTDPESIRQGIGPVCGGWR